MALYLASWLMLTMTAGAPAATDAQAPPTSPPAAEAPPAPSAPGPPAEAPPSSDVMMPTERTIRRIDLGLSGPESDTNSSRFQEYRELPSGPVIPFFRLAGGTTHLYDISAANALQTDARYRVYVEPGPFELDATYVRIPHRFGNEARSLLGRTAPGTFSIEDTLQQSFQNQNQAQFARNPSSVNFAYLNGLAAPAVAAEAPFDLALQRDRGRAELRLTRDNPLDVRLSYAHEKRVGTRESGTSFGFNNVVQSPEPIDYRTQDVGLSAEWAQSWGLLRGGVRFNLFDNAIGEENFDNPWRATSTTSSGAYQAPGSSSVDGPAFGRIALPPTNHAVSGSLGGVIKLGRSGRLSADATYGQWTQDEQFIPFSSNSAITTPFNATSTASLPAQNLDGQMNVFSLASVFSYRPLKGLGVTARYRRYDLENPTGRISFPQGYVRFDAAVNATGRISVPYGYTNDQAVASASYDLGTSVTVEGGYRYDGMQRTFRETEKTTQNTLFAAAVLRLSDKAVVRAGIETGDRDFDGEYELEHSEDASFLNAVSPTNQAALRRFDQARRDSTRVSALAQFMPTDKITLSASYLRGKDDYEEAELGLQDALNEAFNLEADYTPGERLSLYAFYTRENIDTFQIGRQSGSTPSTNPLDNWTADLSDKVDYYGAGATAVLMPGKLDLKLLGTYQKVDGNADLFARRVERPRMRAHKGSRTSRPGTTPTS